MAGKVGGDDDVMGDINVTPFVDVVLVLLIVFMVVSTVIKKENAPEEINTLEIAIPAASNSERESTPTTLSIEVMPDPAATDGSVTLALNGEPVASHEALRLALEAEVARRQQEAAEDSARSPQVQVLVTAPGQGAYQHVIDVVDLARGAGVSSVSLNTRPRDRDFTQPTSP